jgi:hypothetical protein
MDEPRIMAPEAEFMLDAQMPDIRYPRPALFVVSGKSRRGADSADAAAETLEGGGIQPLREECVDARTRCATIRRMASSIDMDMLGGATGR